MIPLSDIDRKPQRAPVITGVIIAVNVFVFVLEALYGAPFVIRWSYIPAQIVAGQDLITLLTALFIHGSLLHIAGNMIFFRAFAPEIEDVMGRGRFCVFYLLGGLVASLAQITMIPYSDVPNMGASGAIAAVMGAFLISLPYDRIRTVVFLGFFFTITLVPSILLVGLWFLLQLFSEAGALAMRQGDGIAYVAHVGGFIFGMFTGRLFMYRRPAGL
jgi:membrane associated rhomboid family serine protease